MRARYAARRHATRCADGHDFAGHGFEVAGEWYCLAHAQQRWPHIALQAGITCPDASAPLGFRVVDRLPAERADRGSLTRHEYPAADMATQGPAADRARG